MKILHNFIIIYYNYYNFNFNKKNIKIKLRFCWIFLIKILTFYKKFIDEKVLVSLNFLKLDDWMIVCSFKLNTMQKNNKIYAFNLCFFIFFIFIFYNYKIINKNFFIFNLKDIYALCKCNLIK